jgi:hypothetical protein
MNPAHAARRTVECMNFDGGNMGQKSRSNLSAAPAGVVAELLQPAGLAGGVVAVFAVLGEVQTRLLHFIRRLQADHGFDGVSKDGGHHH